LCNFLILKANRDKLAKRLSRQIVVTDTEELRVEKRRVKSVVRKAAKNHDKKILESRNTRDAWRFIRETTFTTQGNEKNHIQLDVANEYFASVVQSESDLSISEIALCDSPDAFDLEELKTGDVGNLLYGTRTGTAAGCDDLPAFLIKSLAYEIAPNIAKIMNCSIAQGLYPLEWKKANIKALWKGKGSREDPVNYRPISVLPILSRLFEKTVASQLSNYCEFKSVIPDHQFGFRRDSSCETALLSATNEWMQEIDKGKIVGALLIDLSKAFDTV
jgi:hypothetical protein